MNEHTKSMDSHARETMEYTFHNETKLESTDSTPRLSLSPPDNASVTNVKSKMEKRLLLKQDVIIIPLLSLGYFFGYLDRGSIGNARLMGLAKDLNLNASEYYDTLMMFFVGFLVAELPAAILMRKVPAQYVFGVAIILFGVCATCISVAGGFAGLMVLRTILGIGEAVCTLGFLYLSMWYRPHELALRNCLVYISTPVAGFASGLIAYGVQKNLEGVDGFRSWQWLFMVNGFPTIALGLVVCFVLPSLPDDIARKGHFLFKSMEERELILARQISAQNAAHASIKPRQIWVGLKDPKSYLGGMVVGAPALAITAFVIFLPTFIKEFGFTALDSQLYSIIPYAFAIVTTPLLGFLSDHYKCKAVPLLSCMALSITGLIILLSTTNSTALIAGSCFVVAGAYPAIGIGAAWVTTLHGGYTKRCTAFGVSQVFVQCYSIIGTQVYNTPPRFYKGHGVLLGIYAVTILSVLGLWWWCGKCNRERDAWALQVHGTQADRTTVGESEVMCFEESYDYHPDWRYPL